MFDRDATRGEQVASEIGGVFCEIDVTSDEKVKAAFEKARAAHGQERILVNCAGVANAAKTVGRDKETKAAKALSDAAVRAGHPDQPDRELPLHRTMQPWGWSMSSPLADGERGVIINTASVAAEDGQIGQAAYSASKGGVLAMTLPIARDLMNEGMRVNTILPGVFKTPMVAMMPPNVQDALGAQVPFPKRLGQRGGICAARLLPDRKSYMNAAAVRLDGGIRMAPR